MKNKTFKLLIINIGSITLNNVNKKQNATYNSIYIKVYPNRSYFDYVISSKKAMKGSLHEFRKAFRFQISQFSNM